MKNPKLIAALTKLKMQGNLPSDLSTWNMFLSELDQAFEESQIIHEQDQSFLELGSEELQKVWQLTQEREHLIKTILDASQDTILTLNERAQVIEFNHGAESMFGISKDQIKGQSVFKVLCGGSLYEGLKCYFTSTDSSLTPSLFGTMQEGTLINSAGIEFPISIFASKVILGERTFYPLYLTDLSAKKQAEQAVLDSREQLLISSKMSALGEMAGGVAHEINTPLAVIQLRTDQLLDALNEVEIDRELFSKALKGIDTTVKRIGKIVYGLRVFARDGTKDPLSVSKASEIVDDTLALCQEKFKNHGVDIQLNIDPEALIKCRAGEITQVLLNLLNNSYDATQGILDKWVRIDCTMSEDSVELSVTDCGLGIPPEIQSKIMQPFFTTKEVGKGTGLGLSISRGIMEHHHGQLDIDNSCKNTRFVLRFPRYKKETIRASS